MDSLCECFTLSPTRLGQIMKMTDIELAQWQKGEKKPHVINICRLFLFLIRHYTQYFHHDLIAKEYRWGKAKLSPTSSENVELEPKSNQVQQTNSNLSQDDKVITNEPKTTQ